VKQKAKPKRAKLSTLIDKADRLASLYIRQKHADHAGYVTCISCDTVLHWKDAHCAHYIERGKKASRWLEENLKPACCGCNTFNKEFHMREYTLKMIDLYGREFVDSLRESAKRTLGATEVRMLAEEAIEYYGKSAE
jgi:hypothetical protein